MQGLATQADIVQEMYYLAITFIFIGLGCLLYLFVVRSFQGRHDSEMPEQGPEESGHGRSSATGRGPIQQNELEEFGFAETETSSFPMEQESERYGASGFGYGYSQGYAREQSQQYQDLAHRRSAAHPASHGPKTGSRESLWSRSVATTEPGLRRSGAGKSRFEGILFLDESGQAVSAAENWQQVSPDLFSKLKRMGPCQLQYSDRMFLIHSDTIRLQYRADDLTRILFLDSGFAFIPERGGPSPLILTREVDRFKNFLRDNSL